MSVERHNDDVVFCCDGCGEYLETHETDFPDAMRSLRDAGWKAKKAGAYWEHICDMCDNDVDDFEDVE